MRAGGNTSFQGSITKHGNPRIRKALIELSWRIVRFQPQYPPIQRWKKIIQNRMATSAAKKKAIVAIGRKLAIDLWRINTGRTTPEKLGLVLSA